MAYETFSYIYDEVMDAALYQEWLAFTKRHLPKKTKKILELACGIGALAVALSKAGFDVTALDLSSEMLSIANHRAISELVSIQFVEGNMLDLSNIEQYEAVTCFSDSLCYMENLQEVQQVFNEVYKILDKDGFFIFDVHSIFQIDKIFPQYNYHYQTDDFAFLWESYSGEDEHSIEHFLTFFVKETEELQNFVRLDELHHERTYALDDYLGSLREAGFKDIAVYSDFLDVYPSEKSKRWFFVCQK